MQAKKLLNRDYWGFCVVSEQLFQDSEPSYYHRPGRRGYFAVLTRKEGERARQKSYPIENLGWVIDHLDHKIDSWISQAEFYKRNRRLVNLLRLQVCFVDLDTHKEMIGGHSPQEQAKAVRFFCDSEGIPQPSLILFSGRGLHVKWLLDSPLPRQALIRWNSVQRHLVKKLAPFGADPGAKDASRVLRIEHTINTKSGEVVRVLDVDQGPDGSPNRWCFETLCNEVLPVDRHQLRGGRPKVIRGGLNKTGLKSFSGRQLAWDRLHDLRTLTEIRGGVAEGERTLHLHWRLNFLLLSGATNSRQMYLEAAELAREFCPDWQHVKSELCTLYAKACAFERGETIGFGNKQYSPLYTPKNTHLIDLFSIEPSEQEQLKTIICKDEKAKRKRKTQNQKNRDKGMVDRASYESQSLSRLKPWEQLLMSRRTWYRRGCPGVGTGISLLQGEALKGDWHKP